MFGDNHHKAIDAQVWVLERKPSNDQIYDEFQDPENPDKISNVLDAALEADRWLQGESESLAANWSELKK